MSKTRIIVVKQGRIEEVVQGQPEHNDITPSPEWFGAKVELLKSQADFHLQYFSGTGENHWFMTHNPPMDSTSPIFDDMDEGALYDLLLEKYDGRTIFHDKR